MLIKAYGQDWFDFYLEKLFTPQTWPLTEEKITAKYGSKVWDEFVDCMSLDDMNPCWCLGFPEPLPTWDGYEEYMKHFGPAVEY